MIVKKALTNFPCFVFGNKYSDIFYRSLTSRQLSTQKLWSYCNTWRTDATLMILVFLYGKRFIILT